MTNKEKYTFLGAWFVTIAVVGLGWNWFLTQNHCQRSMDKIYRVTTLQDGKVSDHLKFRIMGLDALELQKDRKLIEAKEPFIKAEIEHFNKGCGKRYQAEFITILKGWNLYITNKELAFQENLRAEKNWAFDLMPSAEFFKN